MTTATDPFASTEAPPLTRQTLDGLAARAGVPSGLLEIGDQHFGLRDTIARERFAPDKQQALFDQAGDTTIEKLLDVEARGITEAKSELTKAISAIAARATSTEVPKERKLGQTSDEYTAELLKRQIADTQALQQATLASADVAVAVSADPGTLAEIIDDALASGHPDRVKAVGRAVTQRLHALALDEARSESPDRTARDLALQVGQRLSGWQKTQAEQDPATLRQRALDAFEMATQRWQAHTGHVARAIGLDQRLAAKRAIRKA